MKVTAVLDAGNDVLLVRGEDDEGNALEATGWVSATTNHYDEDDYEDVTFNEEGEGLEGRRLKASATPRAMTAAEVGAYALSLLEELHAPAPESEHTPIDFE